VVGTEVPYQKIATYCGGLIFPLLVGLLVQRRLPRIARVLVRLLKPISTCLILFIVVFAIITNYYLFYLFSWQVRYAYQLCLIPTYCISNPTYMYGVFSICSIFKIVIIHISGFLSLI